MREYSVPTLVDVPASAHLADTVFRRGEQEPTAVMLRRQAGSNWPDVSAADFRDQVLALAKRLVAEGIEPGDRVAIMSRTRYEWTLVDYAVWTAGAVSVPVYETSAVEQVRWILSDSGARAAFVELDAHEETVRAAAPDLKHLWRMDSTVSAPSAPGALDSGSGVEDAEIERRRAAVGGADLATVIYTSGTTGTPKGCRLTHDNLLFTARNVAAGPLAPVFEEQEPGVLLFLPLAHVFARLIQVVAIETGTILSHTPNMRNVAPDLVSAAPTLLLGVPRVFEKVYNAAEQKAAQSGKGAIFARAGATAVAHSRADGRPGLGLRLRHALFDRLVYRRLRAATGGRLTAAICGGSALGERLGHFFRGVGIEVLEGYGLTETSAPCSVNPPGAGRIGTVGRPLPGVSIRVGDDGEILVKGRHVFAGYWNDDRATAEVIDADGWFHTGDVGDLDADGYLRITGRKKELLVTAAGKNVAPAPLEDALRAHPLVSQALVVGDDRPYVAALVTLDPEALEHWGARHGAQDASPAELSTDARILAEVQSAVDNANRAVSRAEQIKRFTILDADLTEDSGHLTPTLKIKRALVTRDFADAIEGLYTS
ncbi:long-chain fatty acid--CoA ligase [Nonomuraea longicatena]|uniref:Acyl-CoA synthetase n=1 Tax=Nonomuraea longicatena TaxID=83682 RepID=A0ABN1PS73_9ACTN